MNINNAYIVFKNILKTTGMKIKVAMWSSSYNSFVSMSGIGTVRFHH